MGYPPKRYGDSKIVHCPFCGKMATQKNEQGLEVCPAHRQQTLEEIKCTCGKWLEQHSGKFGAYFHCVSCGNISFRKAMEMKEITAVHSPAQGKMEVPATPAINARSEPRERTITSHDVEFFDD